MCKCIEAIKGVFQVNHKVVWNQFIMYLRWSAYTHFLVIGTISCHNMVYVCWWNSPCLHPDIACFPLQSIRHWRKEHVYNVIHRFLWYFSKLASMLLLRMQGNVQQMWYGRMNYLLSDLNIIPPNAYGVENSWMFLLCLYVYTVEHSYNKP